MHTLFVVALFVRVLAAGYGICDSHGVLFFKVIFLASSPIDLLI
jgi:hypothetical protein